MKSKSTMFILWLCTGILGGHRFYVGKNLSGIIYLFTAGLFFIGWGLDFFRLGSMVDNYNLRYGMLHGGINQNNNQNTNQNNIVINMGAPATPAAAPAPAPAATPAPSESLAADPQKI